MLSCSLDADTTTVVCSHLGHASKDVFHPHSHLTNRVVAFLFTLTQGAVATSLAHEVFLRPNLDDDNLEDSKTSIPARKHTTFPQRPTADLRNSSTTSSPTKAPLLGSWKWTTSATPKAKPCSAGLTSKLKSLSKTTQANGS